MMKFMLLVRIILKKWCSDSDGCFFTDSYAKNGIIEHLNSSYICFMPKDYKYKNKLLCKYKNYKELIDDVD